MVIWLAVILLLRNADFIARYLSICPLCSVRPKLVNSTSSSSSSSSSSMVIYTQRLKTTVTRCWRLDQTNTSSTSTFDCDVGPMDICWQAVPESWSGGSERTIAEPCACGNARTGVVVRRPELVPTSMNMLLFLLMHFIYYYFVFVFVLIFVRMFVYH